MATRIGSAAVSRAGVPGLAAASGPARRSASIAVVPSAALTGARSRSQAARRGRRRSGGASSRSTDDTADCMNMQRPRLSRAHRSHRYPRRHRCERYFGRSFHDFRATHGPAGPSRCEIRSASRSIPCSERERSDPPGAEPPLNPPILALGPLSAQPTGADDVRLRSALPGALGRAGRALGRPSSGFRRSVRTASTRGRGGRRAPHPGRACRRPGSCAPRRCARTRRAGPPRPGSTAPRRPGRGPRAPAC